ncbi:hypothetical protein [Desulfosporosinus sp. FKA]|uniref:hypothetical protein n=1 Tax=Desulfosporosinus sp. FKA TaxID=1969834 RepID=UPI000B49F71F|nr:hypothetical protein [Desulfosporosinus sp. FKA]
MQITDEMTKWIKELSETKGYICHGLVNYQKGVSAVNEESDPSDPANFFPQQCTTILKTLGTSLNNLDGGIPDKLIVEASKMTMIIFPVNDTYFCGVGLTPGTETAGAIKKLTELRAAFSKAL